MQVEDALLSLGWGTAHSTRATSWAMGLSQRMLPFAPDTAAMKVHGEEKPGGDRPNSVGLCTQPTRCQTFSSYLAPGHSPYHLGSFILSLDPYP